LNCGASGRAGPSATGKGAPIEDRKPKVAMIGRSKGGFLLPATLVLACGTAAWMAYNAISSPAVESGPNGGGASKLPEIGALGAELTYAMPPMESFDAILKRPMFTPGRRPVAGAPLAVASPELGAKLLGHVGTDSEIRVALKPEDGGETVNLRQGEDYRGWTFEETKNGEFIFRSEDGREIVLELNYEEKPAVQPRSRRERQRAAQQTRKKAQQGQQKAQGSQAQEGEEEGEEEEQGEAEEPNQ
jgi:hypothetical protein